jgi:hypothetical protein
MGTLLLLMTICGLIVAAILMVFAFWTNRNWLKSFVLGGVMTWLFAYIFLLFCGSFFSVERTLAFNEPKEFCGFYFDCHLHTAVMDARKTKTLGDLTANGEFYILKVKVSSDAKRESLRLVETEAKVIDAQNREFRRNIEAEKFLGAQPEFETTISPNESFTKEIVFDVPTDAKNLRLDLKDGYGIDNYIEAILIGDEDSILHKRNYFQIEPETQTASR